MWNYKYMYTEKSTDHLTFINNRGVLYAGF